MDGKTQARNDRTLAGLTIVLGVVIGFSSLLLGQLLDLVEHLFLGFVENNRLPVALHTAPGRRLLSLVVGAVIAAVVWYFLQRKWQPVGIGAALKGERMPVLKTVVHVVTQIFYVSTGGSIGRELAPRQAGAMIADNISRLGARHGFALAEEDRRLLIAAAAGAGFAGVYISPLTGTMFCLELLYKRINQRSIAVSVTMCSIATMVGSITKGFVPYYLTGNRHYALAIVPFAVVIGLVNGLLGTGFKALIKRASAARVTDRGILWQFPLVGLFTGLVAMVFPAVCGNGRGLAQLAMNTKTVTLASVGLLVFGFLVKGLATLLTIRGGGYGGVLTPSIALGACSGILLGGLFGLVVGLPLGQCAVLGAASLLAASNQAPLMALFMLFEVCHLNYSALLPLALTVGVSIWVAKQVSR